MSTKTRDNWKESEDYKQAVYAANKALDEPYADPDDDLRTVARQFLRMVDRYNYLENKLNSIREEERLRFIYWMRFHDSVVIVHRSEWEKLLHSWGLDRYIEESERENLSKHIDSISTQLKEEK